MITNDETYQLFITDTYNNILFYFKGSLLECNAYKTGFIAAYSKPEIVLYHLHLYKNE